MIISYYRSSHLKNDLEIIIFLSVKISIENFTPLIVKFILISNVIVTDSFTLSQHWQCWVFNDFSKKSKLDIENQQKP